MNEHVNDIMARTSENSYGTITIKKFGPIKDATIDLRQLMLFIGPQGNGKSTIMKLVAGLLHYFGAINFHFENDKERRRNVRDLIKFVLTTYGIEKFFTKETYIKYDTYRHQIEISNLTIKSSKRREYFHEPLILFIPAERIFFSAFSESVNSILANKIPIPEILTEFGSRLEHTRKEIKELNIPILNVRYKRVGSEDRIFYSKDKSLLLSESSSGIQATVPLYVMIESLSRETTRKNRPFIVKKEPAFTVICTSDIIKEMQQPRDNTTAVFIEEPELNLYPQAQKDLVKFLSKKIIAHHKKTHSLFISTHSPYILAAFDNFIQASNAYKKHPEMRSIISKILPESGWINFENVSAYYVEKGTVRSILDKKDSAIKSNQIDKVTENISIEFDKLLDLKYATE